MAAPWRDSAGDLLDVRYSGLGNIAHRAGKGALIIRHYMSDPHWRPAIRASRALVRFKVRCLLDLRHGASLLQAGARERLSVANAYGQCPGPAIVLMSCA